jgi:hypothetical protein
MSTVTNHMILAEVSAIKALMEGLEKSRAGKVDDLLFSALLILTETTNTLSEPNFEPEKILLHCNQLRAFLMDARLVLEGREPIHV